MEQVVPHLLMVDKNSGGITGVTRSPSATPGPPAQGSSARKISSPKFWLQIPVGMESVEETSGAPNSSC